MPDTTPPPAAPPAAPPATPPATPPAAPPPAAPPAAPPATPPAASPPGGKWYEGISNVELKGYAETKGWESAESVVSSYQNLEKLHGVPASEIIHIPKPDDKAGLEKMHTQLGRPEKPEHYKLPVPEGNDGAFAKVAQGWFHELGLSAEQGRALAAKVNEHAAAQAGEAATKLAASQKEGTEALQREWGAAYKQNEEVANRAAAAFGMKDEQLVALRDSLGPAEAMKFLHNIGLRLGEDGFVGGDTEGFKGAITPAAAQAQITALKGDPVWNQRYLNGGAKERAELERLLKFAYPEPTPA